MIPIRSTLFIYALTITFTIQLLSGCVSLMKNESLLSEKPVTSNSQTISYRASEKVNIENSVVSGLVLSAEELQEDALLLKKVMMDVHPGIFRYNTAEEFEAHFRDFYAKLHRDMAEAEFMKILAQFTEKVRCGHTYLNPWNMREEIRDRLFGGKIYFPFGFVISNGRMFITKNASDNVAIKAGAEILSINGFPASEILDSLYTVAKTDGSNVQAKDNVLELTAFGERDHNFFDFYFPLFFPMKDTTFDVRVQNFGSDEIITHKQQALSKTERKKIVTSRYGKPSTGKDLWALDLQEEMAILKNWHVCHLEF